MAIVAITDIPEGSLEMYDQVSARLDESQADGLMVHTAGIHEGILRVVDVWESREQMERWIEEHVRPAVEAASGGQATQPEPKTYELHRVHVP